MRNEVKVLNKQNEKLDVLIEGNEMSNYVVVFSHGLGAGKGETYSYFSDVAKGLVSDYLTVRFDYSGYGESEGKEVDVTYYKQRDDLESILNFVSDTYPRKQIYIVAHSMGTFIVLLLDDRRIKKAVLTGIPNSNTDYIVEKVAERIKSRSGSYFDEHGITIFPRSNGSVQKFGPAFWKSIREFKPVESLRNFLSHCATLIIHPSEDDVVGNEFMEEYKDIPTVSYIDSPGDHSFRVKEDRERVIDTILSFFKGQPL